ncbi:2-hydroxyacid dehydrogenase [Lacibacterium aquatile]|uniref:2-hydroxyacid dehydrogenase n=1 Tax=Lacibacterium aquatile TaxID=1168082 RepID=A0ABW5DS36_9PROT
MIKITLFSTQPYDRRFFDAAADPSIEFTYQEAALTPHSIALAEGADGVCVFVNDVLDASVLEGLASLNVRAVFLRCAGYNNVDLATARRLGIQVARVPAYSPEAVAEHAVALIMTLNRRTHRAFNRVREGNFNLDGLLGVTLHGRTAGIIGTGKIGIATARILKGFGCRLLAHDPMPSPEFETLGELVSLEQVIAQSDILSLHCPLLPATHHMINARTLAAMKPGAMLVNTSRGGLIDTRAVIEALKSRQLGALAIDVYEQEAGLFFKDRSSDIIDDDIFGRLMTFPNVLVTGHQGFFTVEALTEITAVTLDNIRAFRDGRVSGNEVAVQV